MTEGAAVEAVSEFLSIAGERTYGEMDVLLGGDLTKSADGARYTINVSGRFGAPRSGGTWLPAHSIKIEVWDQDASGGDDLMGTGSTNSTTVTTASTSKAPMARHRLAPTSM